jgi:hypothetical protein
MSTKIIVGLSLLFLFIACNQSGLRRDAKKVYDNRDELIKEFNNIDVWRRGDSAFLLHIYNDGKANRYLFRGDNGLKLQSDTVQFPVNKIERFKNISTDTISQNTAVRNLLIELLDKMNALDIREVSSDRMSLGINSEFFLRKGGVVFFIRDFSSVTNPVWQNYIKESRMIGEGWYYNKK